MLNAAQILIFKFCRIIISHGEQYVEKLRKYGIEDALKNFIYLQENSITVRFEKFANDKVILIWVFFYSFTGAVSEGSNWSESLRKSLHLHHQKQRFLQVSAEFQALNQSFTMKMCSISAIWCRLSNIRWSGFINSWHSKMPNNLCSVNAHRRWYLWSVLTHRPDKYSRNCRYVSQSGFRRHPK